MAEDNKKTTEVEKIVYYYPVVDIDKKKVKGVVTVNDRLYLSASVDLMDGLIHVEMNSDEFQRDTSEDYRMIDEIRTMAEFIILNQVTGYGNTFLN